MPIAHKCTHMKFLNATEVENKKYRRNINIIQPHQAITLPLGLSCESP